MSEIYRINDEPLLRQLEHVDKVSNIHRINAMDALAHAVITHGGVCDELTLIGAFFGRSAHQFRNARQALSLAHPIFPTEVSETAERAAALNYEVGEPFIFGKDATRVGMIARSLPVNERSPVLKYGIEVRSDGILVGAVTYARYFQVRDAWSNLSAEPVLSNMKILTFNRAPESGPESTTYMPGSVPDVRGMSNIRRAVIGTTELETYDLHAMIDESVAAIREYADDAVSDGLSLNRT